MSFVISEMIRLEPFDTMGSITERALARASDTGVPQRFEFNRNLFEAQPDKPGYGTVVMIGEVRRDRQSREGEARDAIMACSTMQAGGWTPEVVASFAVSETNRNLLVVGQQEYWCDVVHRDIRKLLRSVAPPSWIESNGRTWLKLTNGSVIRFKTFQSTDWILGQRFDVAFLEERQKEVMGGNYNKFPYRSMDRDRARFEERQERVVRAEARWANFQEIEQDRMAAIAVKAQEERDSQSRYVALKPRGLGATALAVSQMQQQAMVNLQNVQKAYESATGVNLQTGQSVQTGGFQYWYGSERSTWPSYDGISRSQNPEQEVLRLRGLLQTVDRVLGRHLREQLTAAPSQGSVYASGPGYAVTAFEIRQVVQALDTVSGQPQPIWWGVDPSANSADFTAESEDGEKIVLTKDGDRFESGVLFDPANRPIRKFKLKELAA